MLTAMVSLILLPALKMAISFLAWMNIHIVLARNKGGCQFEISTLLSRSYKSRPRCTDLELVDLDGDGDLDIVATLTIRGAAETAAELVYFINDGSGEFMMEVITDSTLAG
jgi:hypothetical protein